MLLASHAAAAAQSSGCHTISISISGFTAGNLTGPVMAERTFCWNTAAHRPRRLCLSAATTCAMTRTVSATVPVGMSLSDLKEYVYRGEALSQSIKLQMHGFVAS